MLLFDILALLYCVITRTDVRVSLYLSFLCHWQTEVKDIKSRQESNEWMPKMTSTKKSCYRRMVIFFVLMLLLLHLLKVRNDLFSALFVSRFMKWINCFAKNFFCCCSCCCRRCCCIFSRCCYLRWWWRRCCCSCLCCRWLRCRWFEQVGSNGIDWCCARRNIVVKSGDVLGYYGW